MLKEMQVVLESFADKYPTAQDDKFGVLEKMKGAAGYTDMATQEEYQKKRKKLLEQYATPEKQAVDEKEPAGEAVKKDL